MCIDSSMIDGNSSLPHSSRIWCFRRSEGKTERKRTRWYLLPLLCKSVVTTTVISGRDGRDWTRLMASEQRRSVLEKESHVPSYVIKERWLGHDTHWTRDTTVATVIINELSFFRRAWSNGFSNFCAWLEESWCIIEMHHLWRPLWCASNSSLWTLLLLSCEGFCFFTPILYLTKLKVFCLFVKCIRPPLAVKPECPNCRKATNECHLRTNPVMEETISAWSTAR
jgi:hypothetical protein